MLGHMRALAFLALLAAAAGCGKDYKYAGEECVATSECAPGLVCDLGQDPAVCAEFGTPQPDAGPPPIDAPPGTIDAPPTPIDAPPTPIDAPMIDAQPIDAEPIDAMPIDAV
jgi:hypothetical protein